MYNVSPNYIKAMNGQIRNPTKARIVFGLNNTEAQKTVSITDTDHIYYSQAEKLVKGINVSNTYHTLERNRFILDGRNILAKRGENKYQGYCSNTISGTTVGESIFDKEPKLIFEFERELSISGMTFEFDETGFPTRTRITSYDSSGNVGKVKDYKIADFSSKPTLTTEVGFPNCKKIVVEFFETFPSHRRVRVLSVLLGRTVIIDDETLTKVTFKNDGDLVSAKLPEQKLSFSLVDTENSYDIDNPDSIQNYLESGQPITYSLGYDIQKDYTEWVNVCKVYTNGNVNMTGTKQISTLTFEAESILSMLDVKYDEVQFKPMNLYDLAMDMSRFVDIENLLELDSVLKEYTTTIPLPNVTVREALQLIANAACCHMSINRDGQIIIARERDLDILDSPNFVYDFSNMIEPPKSNKIPKLRGIKSAYNTVSISDKEESLFKSEFDLDDEYVFTLDYPTSVEHRLVTSSDLKVVGNPIHFANSTKLILSGKGTIEVFGKKITNNQISTYKGVTGEGSDVEVVNPIIDNSTWLSEYIEFMANYYNRRTTYEFKDRGYPNIDVFDVVGVENNYNDIKNCKVIESTLEYTGALSCKTKVLSNVKGV